MVASAIIPLATSVIGAGASIFGASKAADAQSKAADKANATQMAMFNTTQNNLAPYMKAGASALPDLSNFDESALENTPGYKFALAQGLKSVQNSFSARALGASGAAQKGAADFATGLADQTYGANFNRLMQRAQLGENAAAGVGSAALSTGQGIAQTQAGVGNAQAAAWNAGAGAVGTAANQIGGYYLNQNKLAPYTNPIKTTPGMGVY